MKLSVIILSAIGSIQAWSMNRADNVAAVDRRNVLSGIAAAAFGVATVTTTVPVALAADFTGSFTGMFCRRAVAVTTIN